MDKINFKNKAGIKMDITLKKIEKEEQEILHNLMQFYIYDFSQFISSIELDVDGKYKPFELDAYWSDPSRAAYFIKINTQLAGFVLLSKNLSDIYHIEEFFVMRKYNGKGIGKS
ncbi:MAG: GNAT family N-acetyltransferase, partial [Bacillota bacterium]|nr:GNAT family N-acetyltransferase [Bacillota bacterium]